MSSRQFSMACRSSGASSIADGGCPTATVADAQGLEGAYPQQLELTELESVGSCGLAFSENPEISALNEQIAGNEKLPAVADRLPEEPLVVMLYGEMGTYGGTLAGGVHL